MLFRENTVEEFIDSLSAKDLKFVKELLKELAKAEYYEEVHYEDDSVGYQRAYQDEMIRAMIHGHYHDERFKKKDNTLKVVSKRIKKAKDGLHK